MFSHCPLYVALTVALRSSEVQFPIKTTQSTSIQTNVVLQRNTTFEDVCHNVGRKFEVRLDTFEMRLKCVCDALKVAFEMRLRRVCDALKVAFSEALK